MTPPTQPITPLQVPAGQPTVVNPLAEIERLTALVQQLQKDGEALRRSLAEVTTERNLYLQEIYAQAHKRIRHEFEDVDIDELKKMSAGPVELLE